MSKKKKRSTKVDKNYSAVIIVLTVVLAALIVAALALSGPGGETGNGGETHGTEPQATDGVDPTNGSENTGAAGGGNDPAPVGTSEPAVIVDPAFTLPPVVEPTEPAVLPTIGQEESSYEHWLAAGMVMAASMEYPDFQVLGIYAASETPVAYHATSSGAYVHIMTGGEELLIHSVPLDGERSTTGTTDLYTAQLGFATFDPVAVGSVDLGSMEKLELEDLSDLISQSLLVSLYGR